MGEMEGQYSSNMRVPRKYGRVGHPGNNIVEGHVASIFYNQVRRSMFKRRSWWIVVMKCHVRGLYTTLQDFYNGILIGGHAWERYRTFVMEY
jgi:hypothetical protein